MTKMAACFTPNWRSEGTTQSQQNKLFMIFQEHYTQKSKRDSKHDVLYALILRRNS